MVPKLYEMDKISVGKGFSKWHTIESEDFKKIKSNNQKC